MVGCQEVCVRRRHQPPRRHRQDFSIFLPRRAQHRRAYPGDAAVAAARTGLCLLNYGGGAADSCWQCRYATVTTMKGSPTFARGLLVQQHPQRGSCAIQGRGDCAGASARRHRDCHCGVMRLTVARRVWQDETAPPARGSHRLQHRIDSDSPRRRAVQSRWVRCSLSSGDCHG